VLLRWKARWKVRARPKQLPPPGDWAIWGLRTGRGWGKTETGATWLGQEAASDPGSFNFVIAPTYDDVKNVCFEGPTGLLSVIPKQLIESTTSSPPAILLKNQALIRGFAAETPERLRGPQCGRAWCDEVASWRYGRQCWDNFRLGLRLGKKPRTLWTGTPKPTPFVRELLKLPNSVIITGSTYENRDNLPQAFFDDIKKYEGTAIGRQELYGEVLDAEDSGFIRRSQWRMWPADKPLPRFVMVLLSLDTAFTEKTFDKKEQTGDPSAGSCWGVFEHEGKPHALLLDCWQAYLSFPELIKRVKKERQAKYGAAAFVAGATEAKYGQPLIGARGGDGRTVDVTLIEDKGSGISLRQALAVEEVIAVPYNPGNMDKLARLHIVSPLFAAGRVWAVESAVRPQDFRDWAEPLVAQVCTYVGEGSLEHDDLLDTTTQALKYIGDRFMGALTKPPKTKVELEEERIRSLPKPMVNGYAL
jgi:predicted phage terminase large subunit-like protein